MTRHRWFRTALTALCLIPGVGTLLSLSRRTHWIFRVWDFPRVQIALLAAMSAGAYAALFGRRDRRRSLALLGSAVAVVTYQLSRIYNYTRAVRPSVRPAVHEDRQNRIVLLMTNVLMENEDHRRLLAVIEESNPDVILAVEVDHCWARALEPLDSRYPHQVRQPLDNYYGMILFSRFELVDPTIEFLVQEDIPSIRTGVRLPSGQVIAMHGLHPRPPEPIRDQPSSPRDAELVAVGRAIGKTKGKVPTIVAGDLNDVAWSTTSELFVRLSGLLDPRVGRGFFNSFNAKSALFRYPLDHVFHSIHFELVRFERLRAIGSDHFPILIELQYSDEAARVQEVSHREPGDERLADEKLEAEAEDASKGYDRPRGE